MRLRFIRPLDQELGARRQMGLVERYFSTRCRVFLCRIFKVISSPLNHRMNSASDALPVLLAVFRPRKNGGTNRKQSAICDWRIQGSAPDDED